MWKRFVQQLRCPVSGEALTLVPFKETDVLITDQLAAAAEAAGYSNIGRDFSRRIEAGVLLAPSAGLLYPITRGVPLMHPAETAAHVEFVREFSSDLAMLGPRYRFPSCAPRPCERAFIRSFNRSWVGRSLVESHHGSEVGEDRRLLSEIGFEASPSVPHNLLEVGCRDGSATAQACRYLNGDAVGVDLRYGIIAAAQRFQHHPLLHFVQASTFNLPFAPATFDVVYSRGVLQYTYSPREALLAVAEYCRPGGRFSVGVRGPGVAKGTLQHAAHVADVVLRPILSLAPRVLGTVLLAPIVLGAMGVNRLRRHGGDGPTFDRALHSARDRFTPRYAHRHEASEVVEWFREAGFEDIEVVNGLGYHMGDRRNNVRGDRPYTQNEQASTVASHL